MIKSLDLCQVIGIVGNTKNAGKTTVLNALLDHFKAPCILTSIGLDGEDLDQVTHLEKPKVYVRKDDLVVTAIETLEHFTAIYQVIKTYEIPSAMGQMVLCQIIEPGQALLAGPSKVQEMEDVVNDLKSDYQHHILIDGAFFRQSHAFIGDLTILVIGANLSSDMEKTIENAQLNYWRLTLPTLKNEYALKPGNHIVIIKDGQMIDLEMTSILGKSRAILEQTNDIDALYIPKAITDDFIELWTKDFHHHRFDLICQSGVHIQMSDQNLKRLKQLTNNIYVIQPIHVGGVCINPYSPKGYHYPKSTFKQRLSEALKIDVIDVEEGGLHE